MDLDDLLGPNPTVIELKAQNRWEAIDELIEHLVVVKEIRSEDREAIGAAGRERESAMGTGVGFGIALPHATSDLIPKGVAVIGRSREGLEYPSLDGKPVHLVGLFLLPIQQSQKHWEVVAKLAKLLHRSDVRDGL